MTKFISLNIIQINRTQKKIGDIEGGDNMPRAKKQQLTQRADGRYRCKYKGQEFYGATSDEALAAREEYITAMKMGDVYRSSVTVAEYALKWLPRAHPSVSESTYRSLAIHLEKLIKRIGREWMRNVLPSQIKEVFTEEYRGLSNSYIRGAHQLYCALFDAAVADRICRFNPAREKSAQPHKGTVGSHRAITDQEREWIDTLCLDHRARPAVMLMLYAGLRPQEAKALNIDHSVDFNEGIIKLSEFVHLDGWNDYKITKQGKTEKATRDIPLFKPARDALAGHHGMLISSASGKTVTVQAWRSAWESYVTSMETAINGCQRRWYGKTKEHKAILAAGGKLPPWQEFTVVPYDLRHSFCVMCRDNGVELNTCIRWMGHADSKMILKVYDEVSADRSRREAEKIEKALFSGAHQQTAS